MYLYASNSASWGQPAANILVDLCCTPADTHASKIAKIHKKKAVNRRSDTRKAHKRAASIFCNSRQNFFFKSMDKFVKLEYTPKYTNKPAYT